MFISREIGRFFVFLIFLSVFSVSLVHIRLIDKAFLYADAGISDSTLSDIETHLDLPEEYKSFLERVFSKNGGFTESGESVYKHILIRFLPTLYLALFAIVFGVSLSVIVSLESLPYPRISSILDNLSKWILSTPIFIFSIMFLILFFYKWELLPPGGYESGSISYLILPGLSLGIRVYSRLQLYISQTAREEFSSVYFLILRTRGLPERIVNYKHFLLKILPTLIVLVVLDLGSLLSGAMVVEEIFFYPGVGRSFYYAIKSMDGHLLQVLILYSGILFYCMNRFAILYQRKILRSGEDG